MNLLSAVIVFSLTISCLAHSISKVQRKNYESYRKCCLENMHYCSGTPANLRSTSWPCFVPRSQVCDGTPQCRNGDDEMNCMNCQAPPTVMFGSTASMTPSRRPVGTRVTYTCNAGYAIVGNADVVCMTSGQWSPPPTCVRACTNLPNIMNGQVTPTPRLLLVGDALPFTCNAGFSSRMANSITCLATGAFSDTPVCNRMCGPVSVPNAMAVIDPGQTSFHQTVVPFTCSTGFGPSVTNQIIVRTCVDGTWQPNNAVTCILLTCPPLAPVAMATIDESAAEMIPGTTVTYMCDESLTVLSGDDVRTCQASLTWSGTAPVCG